MAVGLLPALGGGIRQLAETGQASRLVDGYLRPYARAFGRLFYFSYLPERLEEFTNDQEILERVQVLSPRGPLHRGRRALGMPWAHAREFKASRLLRVFQVTGVIPALIVQARFGVPYVTTYGFWYGRLSRPGPTRLLKRVVERVGLRRAAAVIVTTEELARSVAPLARRVWLIPNGVDTAMFRPREVSAVRRAGEPRRVLYVGRLSAEKNLSALVEAAATLGQRLPIRLVLVGAGPLEPALRRQAAAAGVAAEFVGVVPHRDLPRLYADADAFVLASFTEGHPKVLLEAMSAALPCVASACAGNRSLVTDDETGLLFDPHRPEALADGLVRVLTDEALGARLGKAARELVTARYDLAALVGREIDLLRTFLGP